MRAHFGLPTQGLVRKDWHVLRALRVINAINTAPFQLVFAGGTCLARAYRMVNRMSEDVDFKVVPLDPMPLSRSKRRSLLGDLRARVLAELQAEGFHIGPQDLRSRDENQYTLYHLHYAEDGAAVASTLRPVIQVELTYARLRLPAVQMPVFSFVAEAFGRAPEVPSMPCVNVNETAAEKLVSLTRRTAMELRGLSRAPDPNLVRHIYDLHAIHDAIDRAAVIEMARAIAQADAAEFANQYPAYAADIAGETHYACAALLSEPLIEQRYAQFVSDMVYGAGVGFEAAAHVVAALVNEAWPIG